ncbi:MAG: hypothetical protein HYZ87_04005 [Candidatus Omnitrophica bacterium]|nr:hypothetical protein [Candidatus Omnitrophota bacterium]
MKNHSFVILTFIFLSNQQLISFAAENTVDSREVAIDQAIGGMVEGSRPLPPQGGGGKNQGHVVPGGNLSPSMDTRVTASVPTQKTVNGGTAAGTVVEGSTDTGTSQEGSTEPPVTEPTGGGGTSDSIINLDASADLSGDSPAVDANLAVDTNADSLLDANAVATTDAASTDITAIESGTVAGEDLTTTVNESLVDATLDTAVVATDAPAESEATAGLEADVDPVTADSDVAPTDPADGLSGGL